jgi:hypothetical protein
MINVPYELATPNAASLMQSLRAFGYDISTAIADLIDNSITADAVNVFIQFEWNNGDPWIAITDDGIGMSEAQLSDAMKPGSQNPLAERSENDLGRFGLGLKTASFSQCKKVTVITKAQDEDICVRCWDLDVVNLENKWILLKEGSEISNKLRNRYLLSAASGTVVLWEKIDRIVPGECTDDETYQKAFLDYATAVKQHIAVVFSSYMYGKRKIKFYLNENPIKLWDPFMLDNTFTTKKPTETLFVNNHEVKIQPYVLPHQSNLNNDEFAINAGIHGWTEQQGFYVYRNDRLIVMGDWLLPGMEKKEQYKLARIRVDIGNETDSEWGIDVRKSIAIPPLSIRNDMRRIANTVQKESSKVFRHRGKKIARCANKEKSFIWHQVIRSGKLGYAINRNHPIIKSLLKMEKNNEVSKVIDLIEETVPVPMIISNYTDQPDSLLQPFEKRSTDEFDELIRKLYDYYLDSGYSSNDAIANVANTEPFIYSPEKIQVFCEMEGIDFGR